MNIDETGLSLTKEELVALITFASTDAERRPLHAVQFRADGAKVTAQSTNGHVLVEATGECEGVTGDWLVTLELLKMANKLTKSKASCRLAFNGASLRTVYIMHTDGEECCSLVWPDDAAIIDVKFPPTEQLFSEAEKDSDTRLTSVGANAYYLAGFAPIAKAAKNARIVTRSPASQTDPIYFTCEGDETDWRGLIMPVLDSATADDLRDEFGDRFDDLTTDGPTLNDPDTVAA